MIDSRFNSCSSGEIENHLKCCSSYFKPPLDSYVSIKDYALKIRSRGLTFEAWHENQLVGLIAIYTNNENKSIFITNVSVERTFSHQNVAKNLMKKCIKFARSDSFKSIHLEVFKINQSAIRFYKSFNFIISGIKKKTIIMSLTTKRDYNKEIKDTDDHKYAYNFDFDVMHHYMVESFKPFFNKGNLLELGSFKGDFTKRLMPFFQNITCVEASNEAIEASKKNIGEDVIFINSRFEDVKLQGQYEHIVLTHVLEHLDTPVEVLKRINNEWLSEKGRLFLVCPNANAPSRQIAVKMGLISHNTAITPSEKEHGHNITYTLDTLERDARAAGLKVVHRSGIFFKALANFQWDRLLETDIITKEYLEGCYQLGQQYPDLCSSVFLVCERGVKS